MLFLLTLLPKCYVAVSVTTLLNSVIIESSSASSSNSIAKCSNLLQIAAWKVFITEGSLSLSGTNLILRWDVFVCFYFLGHVCKDIITMSWSLPTSAP